MALFDRQGERQPRPTKTPSDEYFVGQWCAASQETRGGNAVLRLPSPFDGASVTAHETQSRRL
jgi:hypothetical protein